MVETNENQTSLTILELDRESLSYTGKYSMRPDGCNSFEVIFLSTENESEQLNSPLLSTIQIGCLM